MRGKKEEEKGKKDMVRPESKRERKGRRLNEGH